MNTDRMNRLLGLPGVPAELVRWARTAYGVLDRGIHGTMDEDKAKRWRAEVEELLK